MSAHVATVELPEELLEQIDSEVGSEQRSAFLIETARAALQRRRLSKFFESDEPVWKDEDHPDIVAMGTAEWVRAQRQLSERRIDNPEDGEISAS